MFSKPPVARNGVAPCRTSAVIDAPNPSKERQQFHFLGYVVDRSRWTLRWQEAPIALSRKSFDLLVYLIDHRDHVPSKDELMKALWPKQVVEESNLSQHVFLLRKALSRHASKAKIIETVTGRGYRFAAPIDGPVEQPPSGRSVGAPDVCSVDAPVTSAIEPAIAGSTGRRYSGARRIAGIPLAAAIFALGASAGHYWPAAGASRAQEAGISQFDTMNVASRGGHAEAQAPTSEFDRCYTAERTVPTGAMLATGMDQAR